MTTYRHLPTLRQMRYLVALQEHGHFGKAAKACSISQSAFSHAIRELEETLGVQLVDRTHRSVTMTNIGAEVVVQARLCLRDAEALVDIADTRRQPLTGRLVLGVIPTIAPFLLPQVLPKLRSQYPSLQLFLQEGQTATVYQRLQEGTVDVILLALPWAMRNTEVLELFDDPFYLAYHNETTLIDPDNFRLNRLTAGSVMLLEDGHCLRDHALAACRVNNLDKLSNFAASSLMTLLEMVDADLGVTFIPEMAVNSGILKGTHVRTRPMQEGSVRTIGLAWRKGSDRAEEFRLLGDFIARHA